MEYISEIVESNQNLLEEFCIYELSQKKSVEDDKEIEKMVNTRMIGISFLKYKYIKNLF